LFGYSEAIEKIVLSKTNETACHITARGFLLGHHKKALCSGVLTTGPAFIFLANPFPVSLALQGLGLNIGTTADNKKTGPEDRSFKLVAGVGFSFADLGAISQRDALLRLRLNLRPSGYEPHGLPYHQV